MGNRAPAEKPNRGKLDNRGFTLVEMTTTFVLLGIFLVAVTRLVSYTVTLYHETQGASLGMQVTDTMAARIQGLLEDSTALVTTDYYNDEENIPAEEKTALTTNGFVDGGFNPEGDKHIMFRDSNEVIVDIRKEPADEDTPGYLLIKYEETLSEDPESGEITGYKAHDWKFDDKAYMGYEVKSVKFAVASKDPDRKADYPDNVIHMTITLSSLKYGDYTSDYYFKASKVSENFMEESTE